MEDSGHAAEHRERVDPTLMTRCRHLPTHFAVMHNEVFALLMW
jgi:hypothetical protein